jgi:hypothetical protein
MLKLTTLLVTLIYLQQSVAQNTAVIRRKISSIEARQNDSIAIVAVSLPAFTNITIKEKTVAIVNKSYSNAQKYVDSGIAVGRCQLIRENTFYFGVKLKGSLQPEVGDLVSLKAELPECYNGLLYQMSNNAVEFMTVDEKEFYNIETPYLLKKIEEEEKYLKHMVSDIQYTGKEMQKQLPASNQILKDGLYKGVLIFNAMEKTTLNDLKEFLKYIKARPSKYMGIKWKISEIYATWLDAGSPQVIETK